jgi:hypothetical protein
LVDKYGRLTKTIIKEVGMLKRYSYYPLFLVVLAFSLMLATGCSKPPTEEMAKAEKAVEEAKQKEAPLYAEDAFKKAEDSLKKAKDQVAAKAYKEAKQAAIETETLAQQAVAAVEAGKAKMKAEAEKNAEEVQKSLEDLKTDVAAAIKKKLPIAKEEVQAAIGKWEVDFAGAKDKLQNGKFREAFDDLKAILEGVKTKKEDVSKLAPTPPPTPAPAKK